ncbi:hypothetical protein MNBD_NITROSPINAE02-617 [hydrothermal vent metagenome]|uniref:Uncharacterized protein n=1 Tax=hydrothermal vent metagenome TaxID=652676 RepID=A0A3B1BIS4_9ZZZZ
MKFLAGMLYLLILVVQTGRTLLHISLSAFAFGNQLPRRLDSRTIFGKIAALYSLIKSFFYLDSYSAKVAEAKVIKANRTRLLMKVFMTTCSASIHAWYSTDTPT